MFHDYVEDWIDGSFWSLEFEVDDCKVYPVQLYCDGEPVADHEHIAEWDQLLLAAHRLAREERAPACYGARR